MPKISFSIGGATTDITGKTSGEIMKIVKDNYKKKLLEKALKKRENKDEKDENICEDCGVINAEDFSYYENRCGDCCYKKDMRNREYDRKKLLEKALKKRENKDEKDEK